MGRHGDRQVESAPSGSLLERWRDSTTLRPIVAGGLWSFLQQSVSKASALLAIIVGARMLGVADLGLFVSLQAVMVLSVPVWDLGLSPMITRDIAAGEVALRPMLRRAMMARLLLLPAWLAVFAGGARLVGIGGGQSMVAGAILAATALTMGIDMLLDAGLRGHLQFRASALAGSAGRVVVAAAVLLIALFQPPAVLPAMAAGFLAGELTTLAFMVIASRRLLLRRETRDAVGITGSTFRSLRRSLPYALNGFFTVVYNRMDVVIVAAVAGVACAGLYSPASQAQNALMLLPLSAVAAATPLAARRYAGGKGLDGVREVFKLSTLLSCCVTLPATLVVIVFARPLIMLSLGDQFHGSVAATQILALSLPFIAIEGPMISVLLATGRAPASTLIFASGMVVAVAGLIVLTPRWGAEGAAWASMAREPVIVAVSALLLLRGRGQSPTERIRAAVGAADLFTDGAEGIHRASAGRRRNRRAPQLLADDPDLRNQMSTAAAAMRSRVARMGSLWRCDDASAHARGGISDGKPASG